MTWLPTATVLGELEIGEIFVEFDGPRVFSCTSLTDQIFIAGWAEEGEAADLWLYLPVSQNRLRMVRSGAMRLRDAFTDPESFVYLVTLHHDVSSPDQVTALAGSRLSESWLPDETFALTISTPTQPPAKSGMELTRLARQEGRARFTLSVHLASATRTEAPTRIIGPLLTSAQNLLDNIGLAQLRKIPEQTGRIPNDVAVHTSSDVVELAAASFVLELGASEGDDLLGVSPFGAIADTVVRLLSDSIVASDLIDELVNLRPRGAKSFRHFVDSLAKTGGTVSVAAVSNALAYRRQSLTAVQVQTLKRLLNQLVPDEAEEIRGRMRLFAFDMDRKSISLRDPFDEVVFEGRVADRAMEQVDHAIVNEIYDVVLSATASYDAVTAHTALNYVVENLEASGSATPTPRRTTKIVAPTLF
jgi:hypothetical protein